MSPPSASPSSQGLSQAQLLQLKVRQNAAEHKKYIDDLASWIQSSNSSDNKSAEAAEQRILPPPRNASAVDSNSKKLDTPSSQEETQQTSAQQQQQQHTQQGTQQSRIKSSDYAAWDSFDADAEIAKLDFESSLHGSKSTFLPAKDSAAHTSSKDKKESLVKKELGNACFKKGEYEKAIRYYSKAIVLDSTNATLYMNRAMAYIKLEKWVEAEASCNMALSNEPKSVKALWRRALSRRMLGKLVDAQKDIERALVLEPTNKSIKEEQAAILSAIAARSQQLDSKGGLEAVCSKPIKSATTQNQPQNSTSESVKETSTQANGSDGQLRPARKRLIIQDGLVDVGIEVVGEMADKLETSEVIVDSGDDSEEVNSKDDSDARNGETVQVVDDAPTQSTRMKIEEVDQEEKIVDGEEDDKKEESNVSDVVQIIKESKMKAMDVEEQPQKQQQPEQPQEQPTTQENIESSPADPVPNFTIPTTLPEFELQFRSLSSTNLYHYLFQIPPTHYTKLFKSSFDISFLLRILPILKSEFMSRNQGKKVTEILDGLSACQRFSMGVLMLSKKDKESIREVFEMCFDSVEKEEVVRVAEKYKIRF